MHVASNDDFIPLVVARVHAATPVIRALELVRPDGGELPGWTAGAHIKVRLPDGGFRAYSLVNANPGPQATTAPACYRLGIRLEDAGRGGSRFMHGLRPGDIVHVSPPVNRFPLKTGGGPVVLLAGGIGITPLLSMAATLSAEGGAFDFVYAGRSRPHLAFLDELSALPGIRLTVHADDRDGMLDVQMLMAGLPGDAALYVCGPVPMIDAAIAAARCLQWTDDRLNFEIFAERAPMEGDTSFDVVLAGSDRRISVAPDQSILKALLAVGVNIAFDCERGDCGMCQVRVIDGIPDHRDYYLSDEEKGACDVMQVCVSRSKTPVIVLDIPD